VICPPQAVLAAQATRQPASHTPEVPARYRPGVGATGWEARPVNVRHTDFPKIPPAVWWAVCRYYRAMRTVGLSRDELKRELHIDLELAAYRLDHPRVAS